MVASNRVSIEVTTSYVAIRGLLSKGIEVHGPFTTIQEAKDYCGKNFPDDTREIIEMIKKVVTYGEK